MSDRHVQWLTITNLYIYLTTFLLILTYDAACLHSVLIYLHQIMGQITELRLHALKNKTNKQRILTQNDLLKLKFISTCIFVWSYIFQFNTISADNLSLIFHWNIVIWPKKPYPARSPSTVQSPLDPKAIPLAETTLYEMIEKW